MAGAVRIDTDQRVCEMILALSGTSNGRLAVQGFKALEKHTGQSIAHLAEDHEGSHITFKDVQGPQRSVITSPEWSGS